MDLRFSDHLVRDIVATLDAALSTNGIVNVPYLAEEIRRRHVEDNVALEDIAAELLRRAQIRNVAMEFDRTVTSA